jgi:hypothetical protein
VSVQSYARKHPIVFGVGAGAFLLVFVPVAMSLQGFPVATLLNSDFLPKLVAIAIGFGALMALFAAFVARTAERIDTQAAPNRRIISVASIVLALVLFYFIVK